MKPRSRETLEKLLGPALALVTLAVFWPALRLPFLDLDDPSQITGNPYLRRGVTLDAVRWAFTTNYSLLWHPLTWLSHMLDFRLYGPDPWGHHLTSVLLHAASAWLLYAFLRRTTGRAGASAFAACAFALHPLRVESVAWVEERKDALSVFFLLATLLAYAWHAEKPRWTRYAAALAAYAFALMSKPMAVTLPALLLIVDYWPLKRLAATRRIALEKLPFAVLAAAVGLVTMRAQRSYIAHDFPWRWRLPAVPVFYAQYLGKTFWPTDLSLYYAHPGPALSPLAAAGAVLLLAGLTVIAWGERRRRPCLLAGWLWFLVALLPVIGLVQVSDRSIANRFTYIPHIGVAFAVAFLAADLRRLGRLAASAALIALAACAAATRLELGAWADPGALYERTLRVAPSDEIMRNVYGVYLARRGDYAGAQEQFEQAIALKPEYADAHNDLGYLLALQGRPQAARAEFEQALRIDPAHAQARANLARLPAN